MADNRINLMEVRQINMHNVVNALHERGPLTKKELTEVLGLSLATVVTIIKELSEMGIVEQGHELQSTGGRKPVVYQIVPNAKVSLGIALTPHHIRAALTNWTHEVPDHYRERISFENTEEYWLHLKDVVSEIVEKAGLPEDTFMGINIALESRIIAEGGLEDIIPIGAFDNVDMDAVRRLFSPVPVYFSDSLKAAAFSNIGKLSAKNTCVYLQLDRTIGGALISDGNFKGLSNRTGEFGHMYVGEGSRKCTCGNYGCLQTFCSSNVIREESGLELENFFTQVDRENDRMLAIWERYQEKLLKAIYNLRVIFDVDIMIGGEMAPFLKNHLDTLQKRLWQMDIYGEKKEYLRLSNGGEYDGAIGAALMILQDDRDR